MRDGQNKEDRPKPSVTRVISAPISSPTVNGTAAWVPHTFVATNTAVLLSKNAETTPRMTMPTIQQVLGHRPQWAAFGHLLFANPIAVTLTVHCGNKGTINVTAPDAGIANGQPFVNVCVEQIGIRWATLAHGRNG